MRIFGRERETLRVEKLQASRAKYHDTDIQRVEVKLKTEGNGLLTLDMSTDQAHALIIQMTAAYNAIRPPLATGSAAFMGMDDN